MVIVDQKFCMPVGIVVKDVDDNSEKEVVKRPYTTVDGYTAIGLYSPDTGKYHEDFPLYYTPTVRGL